LTTVSSVFQDEIGEMPLELQTKMLRVIQDGEFERLGSSRTIKVDVRVDCRHQPRPGSGSWQGPLPGRSLLPLKRFSDYGAAAAGSNRRHSPAR